MNSLNDIFPKMDKVKAVERIKNITGWIENQPISKLPYVEMGFNALDVNLIEKLKVHNDYILRNYGTVNLNVKKFEFIDLDYVY